MNNKGGKDSAPQFDPLYATQLVGSAMWKAEQAAAGVSRRTTQPYPPPPQAFDGRSVWRDFIPPLPRLRSPDGSCNCGASWAAAPTVALCMRVRIWTKNQARNEQNQPLVLAVGKPIACNWGSQEEIDILSAAISERTLLELKQAQVYADSNPPGCTQPETLLAGWQYLFRFGTFSLPCINDSAFGLCNPDQSSAPRSSLALRADNGTDAPGVAQCTSVIGTGFGSCADGRPALTYRAGSFYKLPEEDMTRDMWKWGPITSAFAVYPDFDAWDGKGVYRWNGRGKPLGGLATVIVGWDAESWMCAGWRGPEWGDGGYFRMARGAVRGTGALEANAMAGYPDMPLFAPFATYSTMAGEGDAFLRGVWPLDASGYKKGAIEDALERGVDIVSHAADLFNEAMVPDYATMVAGRPSDIAFPYRKRFWRHDPDTYLYMLFYGGMLAALIGAVYYIMRK